MTTKDALIKIKTEVNAQRYCYIIPRIIAHVCGKQFTQLQLSHRASVDSVPIHAEFAFQTPARANQIVVLKKYAEIFIDNNFSYSAPDAFDTTSLQANCGYDVTSWLKQQRQAGLADLLGLHT